MLISQLNGNLFLLKDRLTRVRNSIYFNNADAYCFAAESYKTCLLGLESDCRVYSVTGDVKNPMLGIRRNLLLEGLVDPLRLRRGQMVALDT
jgi:hypothetical protein